MIATSSNLSLAVFRGGLLQIREHPSAKIAYEVANIRSRDAILFRISPGLTHRNTAVEGTVPKTAFAGWFRSEPRFLELFADDASVATAASARP